MPASIQKVDFSKAGRITAPTQRRHRVWEEGEHRGCGYVNIRHFHVTKPGGKAEAVEKGQKVMGSPCGRRAGGSTEGSADG